ncbi:MAG: hypothetical protein ABW075_10280 [Aeromicrobium sp.]
MSSSQTPPPPNQPDWDAMQALLLRIAGALENPRVAPVSKEAPVESAGRLVDYLALRQLMGRKPRTGDEPRVFPAAIDRTTTPPELVVGALPPGTRSVAVFIDRTTVADDVPLTRPPGVNAATGIQNTKGYPLPHLDKNQEITRLEFRRADGYPLALGPRLPVA